MPKYTYVCMIAYTNYSSDARVRREAETLSEQSNYQVCFLSLKENINPRIYNLRGVTVHELNISKYQGKSKKSYVFSYIKFIAAAFKVLHHLFHRGNLDIIHIHNMPNFLVFAAVVPRLMGKKLVLDIHDSTPETYLSKFGKDRQKRLLFKMLCIEEFLCCCFAHKIVCVNHVQKDVLVSRGLKTQKILVSLNVPDPKIFIRSERKDIGCQNGRGFKLVYHGTITKRLGIDLAIKAVALLKNKIPNLQFQIMGRGDDLRSFVMLTEELGVSDRVFFNNDIIPLEALPELLSTMDIGVISNRQDPATELMLPVKMLEYMALDIPVVAPRLKAIQYYFNEKMVQFYEPEDVDSLSDAIQTLYLKKDRRQLQVQAAGRFFEVYGWKKHKEGLIKLYNGLK